MKTANSGKSGDVHLPRLLGYTFVVYALTYGALFLLWRSPLADSVDSLPSGSISDCVAWMIWGTAAWGEGPDFKYLFGIQGNCLKTLLVISYQWLTIAGVYWVALWLSRKLKWRIAAFLVIFVAVFLLVASLTIFLHNGFPIKHIDIPMKP